MNALHIKQITHQKEFYHRATPLLFITLTPELRAFHPKLSTHLPQIKGANCLTHPCEPPHDRQLSTIKKDTSVFFSLPFVVRRRFLHLEVRYETWKTRPLIHLPHCVWLCALLLWGGAGPPRPEGTPHLSCGHSCSMHRTYCSVISSRAAKPTLGPVGTLVAIETCWCCIWLWLAIERVAEDIGVVLGGW